MNLHAIPETEKDTHPLPACPECGDRVWRRQTTGTIYEDQILRAYPNRDQNGRLTDGLHVLGDWETIDQETHTVHNWACDQGHPADEELEERLSETWIDNA